MVSSKHIFIIDDDSSVRKGLTRLLSATGYSVQSFDLANKFLEILDEKTSGCILLDIRIPGMSVEELVLELKNRNLNLTIIVVTADDNADTRRKAKEMNALGFFRKPVDGTALLDAINWTMKPARNGKNQMKKNQSNE